MLQNASYEIENKTKLLRKKGKESHLAGVEPETFNV